MKNGVILFKMQPWVFLTELPAMALLVVCWHFNDKVEGLLKLYPLMIALMALIIFLAFYFFRLAFISWEEIHDIGLFTRRDEAVISEGNSLKLTLTKKGQIKMLLLGDRGVAGFDWMKPTDRHELPTYRGNAYGGARALKRILRYFGADEDSLEAILGNSKFEAEYAYSRVSAVSSDEGREIRIDITATLTANGTPIKKQ